MKREWKVGELAKLAGLTVRTLRYYDQIGLFSPSGHTDSGHRIYIESDIAQLQQVLSLKELGLPLNQVKSVIDGNHFSLFDIVSLQIERLKESISVQQKLLQELEYAKSLIQREEPLTVREFTKILSAMRVSHHNISPSGKRAGNFISTGLVILLIATQMTIPKGGPNKP